MAYINGSEKQETYPWSWNSLLREHAERFWDRKKLSASFCLSQEIPILLGAVAGVLVMHRSLGPEAIDSLTTIGGIDPKMSVPLLLAVLYYSNLLSRTDVPCQSLLVRLLSFIFLLIPVSSNPNACFFDLFFLYSSSHFVYLTFSQNF